jgi:hypothetical protein
VFVKSEENVMTVDCFPNLEDSMELLLALFVNCEINQIIHAIEIGLFNAFQKAILHE